MNNTEHKIKSNMDIIHVHRLFEDFIDVVGPYLRNTSYDDDNWTVTLGGVADWWNNKWILSELTQISDTNLIITSSIIEYMPTQVQESWMKYHRATEMCCLSLIDLVIGPNHVEHFVRCEDRDDLTRVLFHATIDEDQPANIVKVVRITAGDSLCVVSASPTRLEAHVSRQCAADAKVVCSKCGASWYDFTGTNGRDPLCSNCLYVIRR